MLPKWQNLAQSGHTLQQQEKQNRWIFYEIGNGDTSELAREQSIADRGLWDQKR